MKLSWMMASVLALSMFIGCGDDPNCSRAGLYVAEVTFSPTSSCITEDHTHPEGAFPTCLSDSFTLTNACTETLTLDLAKAPFKIAGGTTTLNASGGQATFKMDFGTGSATQGTYKIPGTLGTNKIEVVVQIGLMLN